CFASFSQAVEKVVGPIGDDASSHPLPRAALRDRSGPQHPISHGPDLLSFYFCTISYLKFCKSAGYIGSVSFLETVLQVVERLRVVNPGLLYGVPCHAIGHVVVVALWSRAHVGWHVVITSLSLNEKVFLIGSHQKVKGQSPQQFKIVIPKIPAYFTGSGDLMTALLLGWSNVRLHISCFLTLLLQINYFCFMECCNVDFFSCVYLMFRNIQITLKKHQRLQCQVYRYSFFGIWP
ncbi:hypothetical protein GW17_00019193, partial [Ensete ventricosum]